MNPNPAAPRSPWARWARGLFVLGLLGAFATAAWCFAFAQLGRTPGEVINFAQRHLAAHPRVAGIARPLLEGARQGLGEPDTLERARPFLVPSLPIHVLAPPGDSSNEGDKPGLIRVGPTRRFKTIAQAARAAADGNVIEIDAGDYVADVAVWDRAEITIRGLGRGARLLAAGAHAEGKAIWVIRRGKVTVENIEFVGARVPDRNGAGIRMEGGHLRVRNCLFWGNQNGLIAGNDIQAELDVENSEFGYNGAGDGQSHGIYVGTISRFRLSGSYLHHGNVGHLVKSRARESRIEYSRISDETGGRASYELEFPNGGAVELVGNIVAQSAGTRNSVIISFGAEGYRGVPNRLSLAHNTLINDQPQGGTFIQVWPGADALQLRNNLYTGRGKRLRADQADASGDKQADWSDFVRPARDDYRLSDGARAAWGNADLAPLPPELIPQFEYVHPRGLRLLQQAPRWPGAQQAPAP